LDIRQIPVRPLTKIQGRPSYATAFPRANVGFPAFDRPAATTIGVSSWHHSDPFGIAAGRAKSVRCLGSFGHLKGTAGGRSSFQSFPEVRIRKYQQRVATTLAIMRLPASFKTMTKVAGTAWHFPGSWRDGIPFRGAPVKCGCITVSAPPWLREMTRAEAMAATGTTVVSIRRSQKTVVWTCPSRHANFAEP
jgi:hypothetical protein